MGSKTLMDWQAWFSVGLTVGVLVTLISFPRLTTDVVLMAALVLLSITGILAPEEALSGFSNTGLMTVAAMFIIAAAIRTSGGVDPSSSVCWDARPARAVH